MADDRYPFVANERLRGWTRVAIALGITTALSVLQPLSAQTDNTADPDTLSEWRQVRMDGFTVIGTTGAAELQQVARGIAAFRSALTTHLPNVRVNAPLPTYVVVLKDFEAYKRFQPRDSRGRRVDSVAGYLNTAADANFLVFPYVRGEVGRSLIYHEYTHYVIRQNARTEVPLWLEEGLAEFYATFRPDFGDGHLLGAAPAERVRTLKQEPYVSLRNLLSTRKIGQLLRSARSSVFYAEAWALVHYVTMERRNPVRAPLTVYLTTLAATDSQDEAFKQAFGVDVDGMNRELQTYVRYFSFRTIVVPRAVTPRVEQVEPIPQAEATQLEDALVDGRDIPDEYAPDLPAF